MKGTSSVKNAGEHMSLGEKFSLAAVFAAAKKTSKARSVGKPPHKAVTGSKQDDVIALLKRPGGATLDNLVKATGWQPHSVRGFLAGTVRKKLKLQLQSQKADGRRTYRIKAERPTAKTRKSRTV